MSRSHQRQNHRFVRLYDYGKYKYEQTRKEKLAKKKQKVIDVKEVRMSPNIDTNDLNTKIKSCKEIPCKRYESESHTSIQRKRTCSCECKQVYLR